jgi:hypothetical protein
MLSFAWHLLNGERTAEDASQPAADRVLSERATAHLTLGVPRLLSTRFRAMFWLAAVVSRAIFLGVVAAVSVHEILKDKMFLFGVLMSLAHVGSLKAYDLR